MARYGDNIYEIMGATLRCLRYSDWQPADIEAVKKRVLTARSYDEAVEVCGQYITIERDDHEGKRDL